MIKKHLFVLTIFTLLFSVNMISIVVSAATQTTAPAINIVTTNGNGNTIVKSDGYVESSQITVCDKNGNVDVTRGSLGDQIKVRGNTTADGAKKPFNIKLSSKTSLLGMKKNKKWCLLANCFDSTLLRNYIAFSMGRKMGLMVPDYQIVDLTLDGVYKGCYLLTEATENTADIDTDEGEFFIEYEKNRYETETTYFVSDGLRFVADDPEYSDFQDSTFTYNDQSYKDYIQSTLDNLMSILDAQDYDAIKENFDVDSLAKFYLFNEYYKTVDVGFSSVNFIYRNHKLTAGPMWDYDLSSGNSTESNYFDSEGNSHTSIRANVHIFAKLLKCPDFCQLVREYYLQYEDMFAEYYEEGGIIDQTITQYDTLIDKNFSSGEDGAGWDVSRQYSIYMRKPESTYDENISFYKTWLSNRNEWLATYFEVCLHKYTTTVVEPTCEESGYTVHTCSVCGDSYMDAYKQALGHTIVIDEAVPATCTTSGLTEGSHCSVCDKVLKAQEVVAKKDHDWNSDYTVDLEATATTAGSKSIHCKNCNEIKDSQVIPAKGESSGGQTPSEKISGGQSPASPAANSIAALDQTLSISNADEISGGVYQLLQLRLKTVKSTSLSIRWKQVPGATSYLVYGAKCGSRFEKLAMINTTSFTQTGLTKGKYYKYFVAAVNGENVIATSKTVHIATSGGKVGNHKSLVLKKTKVSITEGKRYTLKASLKAYSGKHKVKKHRSVCYESSDPSIATVSSKGVVFGKAKGVCYIYAYAQDGVSKAVKVTVK